MVCGHVDTRMRGHVSKRAFPFLPMVLFLQYHASVATDCKRGHRLPIPDHAKLYTCYINGYNMKRG